MYFKRVSDKGKRDSMVWSKILDPTQFSVVLLIEHEPHKWTSMETEMSELPTDLHLFVFVRSQTEAMFDLLGQQKKPNNVIERWIMEKPGHRGSQEPIRSVNGERLGFILDKLQYYYRSTETDTLCPWHYVSQGYYITSLTPPNNHSYSAYAEVAQKAQTWLHTYFRNTPIVLLDIVLSMSFSDVAVLLPGCTRANSYLASWKSPGLHVAPK